MYIPEQLEMPRFTGTLRAFSSVSQKYQEVDPDVDRQIIRKRAQQKQAALLVTEPGQHTTVKNPQADAVKSFTWNDVILKLTANKKDSAKLKTLLDKLRNDLSRKFLNEDFNDASLLNDAALYLLDKFYEFQATEYNYNSSASHFRHLDKLNKALRQKFGPYERNMFEKCKDLMEDLFDEIEILRKQPLLDDLFAKYDGLPQAEVVAKAVLNKQFGDNVQFYSFYDSELVNSADVEEDSDAESDVIINLMYRYLQTLEATLISKLESHFM